jgi:hypothetical protein
MHEMINVIEPCVPDWDPAHVRSQQLITFPSQQLSHFLLAYPSPMLCCRLIMNLVSFSMSKDVSSSFFCFFREDADIIKLVIQTCHTFARFIYQAEKPRGAIILYNFIIYIILYNFGPGKTPNHTLINILETGIKLNSCFIQSHHAGFC